MAPAAECFPFSRSSAASPASPGLPSFDQAHQLPHPQQHAAAALLQRLLPRQQHLFHLSLEQQQQPGLGPHGWFSVEVARGKVHIHGTSGVELASGVHWFLKYFAGSSVSWGATGGLQLNQDSFTAAALDALEAKGKVTIERAVPFSFYQNVVTMSYSMAFWDWDR